MYARDDSEDSFIDDSEYDTDASSRSGKEKKNGDDGDEVNEVQLLGSGSEDEWKPRRRTRRAAAAKKYSLFVNLVALAFIGIITILVITILVIILIDSQLIEWLNKLTKK